MLKTKALIEELTNRNGPGANAAWCVLIVGQTEAWASGKFEDLIATRSPNNFEVEKLSQATVSDVLRSVSGLEWLATDGDAVSALTNMRTLAWVIQAAVRFQGQGATGALSLTAIADRIWEHWTDKKPSVHRLLVKFAEREAAFEHSFAVSELESGDAEVLNDLPTACPLRSNVTTGRIQFQHDLAADWARFQRLKEIQHDTAQWAPFASNPVWHGALHMLGQFLLRQSVGSRNAWDVAFEAVEQKAETAPLADDMLLDALFLDPNAEAFLDQRTDMLLGNRGARLLRLVKRFEHIASVPGANVDLQGPFRDYSLYIEAHFRTPIFGRWPPMARFLAKHRDRIAKMVSPAIAGICYRWLTSTPATLPGDEVMPFRREFAELALAGAREAQLEHEKGIIYVGESETRIYQAALSGAPDLPTDVSEWALEMAQRRPYRVDIVEQAEAHRAKQAEEHQRRLDSDDTYRERHESRSRSPSSIPFRRKLTPWPLGARRRIVDRFRDAVLRSAGFQALMRTNAPVAGEVLLSCIVEDEPEEEYGSSRGVERELGIEYDRESYPTAPWKSPFFAFLKIDSDTALSYLHQLINFNTERWRQAICNHSGSDPAPLSLRLDNGSTREYLGNHWVFTWSQMDSSFIGQLHCALAALECWLCNLIDEAIDVAPQLDAILRSTNSVAVLGVLVNVGKHQAELFKGPLQPLLGVQQMYEWDSRRAEENEYAFDAMTWSQSGEVAFEMAKNWALAPYRKRRLREIVPKIVLADRAIGDFVLAASRNWTTPRTEKEALELRILAVELDYRNYASTVDSDTGKQKWECAYPEDVATAIAAFEQDKMWSVQALRFPQICRDVLNRTQILVPREAEEVASLMAAVDGDEEIDLAEDMMRAPRVAAAALLLLRAPDWLAVNPAVEQRAQSIIDVAIDGILDESPGRGPRISMAPSHLIFAAYFSVERWVSEPTNRNDERVLRLLTSGDDEAVQVLVCLAYRNRAALGHRWWRLLYLALLWSGLLILTPHYDDDEADEIRWRRWSRWLRTRGFSEGNATSSSIDPLALAKRIERFELKRSQRRHVRNGRDFTFDPGLRLSGGLETHFLQNAFVWLLRNQADRVIPAQELEIHRKIVSVFWAHQAWWQSGSGTDENDDYQPMDEFGYAVLDELARLMVESPAAVAPALWGPVFALGPKGHYAISHFLTSWFSRIDETTVVAEFVKRWRPMVEFMLLSKEWARAGPWYHGQQLERQVLGFGASNYLKRLSDHTSLFGVMRDLFEVWAKKRLIRDEDNLAGFCGFLGTEAGKPLRMDGLQWIVDELRASPELGKWYRDRTSNAFVEFLDVLVSEHAVEISRDDEARLALLALAAHAVSRQLTASLALQERIRRLR